MGQALLSSQIIEKSESKQWDKARLEWELTDVYTTDEPEECACGHFPIIELCQITNIHNNATMIVGNKCVQKFLGISSKKLFDAINRVKKDMKRSLNPAVIDLARKSGLLSAWEAEFYVDTWRKTSLTDKQMMYRVRINEKVIKSLNKKA